MELLSVEYGDFRNLFNGDLTGGVQSACIKLRLFVDPSLLCDDLSCARVVTQLAPSFPSVGGVRVDTPGIEGELGAIAALTASLILDLQRDLCEWPSGRHYYVRDASINHEYDLYVESIDERVGRFAAQVAVSVIRMIMLRESFDLRLIWVIDLVRALRRQPRLRLTSKRVANLLKCSRESAEWAIQGLERYAYFVASDVRRRRRARKGSVLVIDDSAQLRDILGRILELLGYDVVTAVDGEEGLILLDWAPYKAIFVDLIMPCLDGATFLQRARAKGTTCPIFAISAYGYRWDDQQLRSLGATAYVRKPFSVAEIEAVMTKHLKQKK